MKFKYLFLCLSFFFFHYALGQTKENKTSIGIYGGKNEYSGDLGNGLFRFNSFYPFAGLSLQKYLNPSFDVGIQGCFGKFGYKELTTKKWNGSLYLNYKLNDGNLLDETSRWTPFLSAGFGIAGYEPIYGNAFATSPPDFVLPLGAGVKYQLKPNFAIAYKYLYNLTNHDGHDNFNNGGKSFFDFKTDAFGEHWLGFVISFGALKDTDKDGVPDRYDLCANTPTGVKVDAKGCPMDSDEDGTPDYLDKCPNTPKEVKVNANGCPVDTDGDGVPDYLDKCPDTPKGIRVNISGCPVDSDDDGVPDYLDKCPYEVGIEKYEGCPDKATLDVALAEMKSGENTTPVAISVPTEKQNTITPVKAEPAKAMKAQPEKAITETKTAIQPEIKKTATKVKEQKVEIALIPQVIKVEPKPEKTTAEVKPPVEEKNVAIKTGKEIVTKTNKVDTVKPVVKLRVTIPKEPVKTTDKTAVEKDTVIKPKTEDNQQAASAKTAQIKDVSSIAPPSPADEEEKIFDEALYGVQFAPNNYTLTPSSYPVLDKIAKLMLQNPTYIVQITVYSDDAGNAAKNQELSEKRATEAELYIVKKGVKISRFIAIGAGKSNPAANNGTQGRRSSNSRVEFKVISK